MDYRDFIQTVRRRGGFESDERAERLAAATFETVGEVTSNRHDSRLLKRLPPELRRAFECHGQVQPCSLQEFFDRVAAREGTTYEDAERDVLVVVSVLRDAVAAAEIEDLWTRLPGEYRRLLNPGVPPAPSI